jgi:predicted transcriptional regulator
LLVSIRTLVSPFFLLRIESGKAPLIESKLRRILKYFPEIECQKQIDQYWKESVS